MERSTTESKSVSAVNAFAESYETSAKAGQEVIGKYWGQLSPDIKRLLSRSPYYDERGERQTDSARGEDVTGIESLEYYLGVLWRCVVVKLPSRNERGTAIASDAYTDEVLDACSGLLVTPTWHEAPFLRLSLRAIQKHQLANLLTRLLPADSDKSVSLSGVLLRGVGLIVFAVFCYGLALVAPFVLASALVAAAKGELRDTAIALYGLGFIVWMWNIPRGFSQEKQEKPKSADELAYDGWQRLDYWVIRSDMQQSDWLTTGAGAAYCLQSMAREKVSIPPIAFDLCAALSACTLGKTAWRTDDSASP